METFQRKLSLKCTKEKNEDKNTIFTFFKYC